MFGKAVKAFEGDGCIVSKRASRESGFHKLICTFEPVEVDVTIASNKTVILANCMKIDSNGSRSQNYTNGYVTKRESRNPSPLSPPPFSRKGSPHEILCPPKNEPHVRYPQKSTPRSFSLTLPTSRPLCLRPLPGFPTDCISFLPYNWNASQPAPIHASIYYLIDFFF